MKPSVISNLTGFIVPQNFEKVKVYNLFVKNLGFKHSFCLIQLRRYLKNQIYAEMGQKTDFRYVLASIPESFISVWFLR